MKLKNERLSSEDWLIFLSLLYGAISFAMNVFCMKPLSFGTSLVFSDGGQTISWAVFLIANIIVEVWGEKMSTRVISFSAITTFSLLLLGRIIVEIPSSEGYMEQTRAFALVFSNGPRTIISSITAFWVGGLINVKVIAKLKERARKKDSRFLFFFRAAFSSLLGQGVDNFLFMTLAFAPVGLSLYEMAWKDIASSVIIGTVFELLIEAVMVPLITIPMTKKLIALKEGENS